MYKRNKLISWLVISCLTLTSLSFQPVYALSEQLIPENEIHAIVTEESDQGINAAEEADVTPPILNNAIISGNILTLHFNEELAIGSVPPVDDFDVLISNGGVLDDTVPTEIDQGNDIYTIKEDTIYSVIADTAHILEIDIYDNKAVLIIDNAVTASDTITVSYDPSGDEILDISGNPVTAFTDYVADNITGGKGLPDFIVEKIYNELDTSSFSEKLAQQIYYGMIDFWGTKDELRSASSDIVDILATTTSYSSLSEENKSKLISFFGIDDTFFTYCDEKEEIIEQILFMHSKLNGYGLTETEIYQAMQNNKIEETILEKEQDLLDQVNKGNKAGKILANNASTSEDPFADVKYDPEKILSAPFKHNKSANEQIDLASGSLAYNVTDVVLPGAGGLDLVIERQYSTDKANYYDIDAALYYGKASNGNFLYSKMNTYRRMRDFEINADGTLGDSINTTSWSLFDENYTIQAKALRALNSMKEITKESDRYRASLYKKEITTSNTNVSARQITNPVTKNEEMWQLGAGWKFNFSYMEIYSAYFSTMKVLHLSDGREFSVSSNWVNNLGHYTYKDVLFKSEAIVVGGQTSSYSVTYADGKKEYFNNDGRLIAIVDRFGNTISFAYAIVNNLVEMQITDTMGRIITLTNQLTSKGYNKVLTLPGGKTITYAIEQNDERTINELDYLEDFNGEFNEYNLIKVINQVGDETLYEYKDTLCGTDFAARYRLSSTKKFMSVETWDDGDQYYPNFYAGLSKITYPTGFTVNYEYFLRYNNWYDYGCMTDIAIKTRYDNLPSRKYNEKQYSYSYRYGGPFGTILYNADAYSYELDEDDPFDDFRNWWVKETDSNRNISMHYEFERNRGFCVREETFLGSVRISENNINYRRFNGVWHPSKAKIISKRYDTSDGQVLTTIECFDYDDRGNAISYWPAMAEGDTENSEYKVAMTYHPTYNYLTGKTYKRDASTTIKEENIPATDGKTVPQSLVYENEVLKAKSDFFYDTYGNITKSKEYTNLISGTFIETDYDYTSGTYLTGITILNVIDADGTNIGSISRMATYDSYGRILSETDSNGNVTAYTYDDIGRITQIAYPNNIKKTISYDTGLNQSTQTDELGFMTRYQYDPAGNLTEIYSLDGSTTILLRSNEYDRLYRKISEKNNLTDGGSSIIYTYDHKDRIIQKNIKNVSNQGLSNESYSYFDDKMIKTIEGDSNSEAIVTTEYLDKYGRVTKQGRFVDGTEVFNTFARNYLGEMIQEKSARANAENFTEPFTKKYEYDFAGNVKKQYDILGNFTTTAYDAAGRKISVTDAKSNASGGTYSTLYTYDSLGRLVKEETPFSTSAASITKYYYDANGNLVRKQTTNNLPGASVAFTKVEYVYDNKDRLVQVKSYNGAAVANEVDYEYDAAGNMTAMITGSGTQRTTYGYDRYGNMTALTDPLGMSESYVYDINGNMTSKTDKNGQVTNYTYDGLARKLSQRVTVNGIPQMETFGHTATGALAFAQNNSIRTDHTYDELGRLVKELDSNGVEKTYTYDVNGNLKTSVVKVSGAIKKTMAFVYDKKDRLYQVNENGALVATYTYDANGNRNSLTYGNGNRVDYAYNLVNLVTSLQNKKGASVLSSYAYTYYMDGNQATKAENTGKLTNYAYDGLGRLTQEAESGIAGAVTKAYSFDSAGNRATMTVSGAESYTVGYSYDLNNRLKKETKGAGAATEVTDYYYDNNGNTTAKRTGTLTASSGSETPTLSIDMMGVELYGYDGFDRMTRFQDKNGVSTYSYKPDGLRLSKTVNGVTTTHVWEGNQISLELDGDGAVTNRYIRGVGLIKSDNIGWYLFNGHGDVVQLADGTGTVTKTYDYDAFGNEKDIDANDINPFRYTGEYFDKESGSIYLRARYYDPEIGRFISEDSFTGNANDPLSLNLYTYCENDPVNFIDSTGNSKARVLSRSVPKSDPAEFLELVSIAVGFSPLDAGKDALDLISGKDIITQQKTSRGVLIVCVVTPEVLDQLLKNGAKVTIKSSSGLVGKDFEHYLTKQLNGRGSFKYSGREFDGAYNKGSIWYEAKSGGYWNRIVSNNKELEKFKSDIGEHYSIAQKNGKKFELHSNTPIPQSVKEWMNKKGIHYIEWE